MPIDLEERLSRYRACLDQAIADDLTHRTTEAAGIDSRTRRVVLSLAAAGVLVVGLAALALTSAQSPESTPGVGSGDSTLVVDSPDQSTTVISVEIPLPQRNEVVDSVPQFESDHPSVLEPITRFAIGDVVMLGAAGQLEDAGFTVDAATSRSFVDSVKTVEVLAAQGRLGDVVVVGLGNNGPITENDMNSAMQALRDVPTVVFLTARVPRPYAEQNSLLIKSLPEDYQNVLVFDWATESETCPGNCFYEDQFHLRPDGQEFYTNMIVALLDELEH